MAANQKMKMDNFFPAEAKIEKLNCPGQAEQYKYPDKQSDIYDRQQEGIKRLSSNATSKSRIY